ncbi:glia maturation factor beta-like isoform X1 [Biomphalaria pfeifferi]|uniref:Glia maturation factor beta-like isoform X1 n=1 Tax=Biomphalaria pfeifferi TaxID=112525 RepID=A0AAD8F8U5_BIOPF|nr:glia maturation factor beta-like isoform X1 [Biomphalaria pfeifferi]
MSQEVIDLLKKFKLRKEKNIAAIVLKIDRASLKIVLDEEYNDISVSDLQEELPSQQPRYVCLSYVQNHSDGRVSYPLIFIFISPPGVSPELQMMYAGSKTKAVKDGDFTKVIELRSLEDLTEETILDKLKLFK